MLSHRNCDSCYYSDACPHDGLCEYFASYEEQIITEEVSSFIEEGRMAFYTEWFEYIKEWDS